MEVEWKLSKMRTHSSINLLNDLSELAGNVGGVTVEDWSVLGSSAKGTTVTQVGKRLTPAPICPGWLRTMTWALKEAASEAGWFLESEQTVR